MKIRYEAQAIDEDTGEVLGNVSSYDPTGLEHELSKLDKAVETRQEADEQELTEEEN